MASVCFLNSVQASEETMTCKRSLVWRVLYLETLKIDLKNSRRKGKRMIRVLSMRTMISHLNRGVVSHSCRLQVFFTIWTSQFQTFIPNMWCRSVFLWYKKKLSSSHKCLQLEEPWNKVILNMLPLSYRTVHKSSEIYRRRGWQQMSRTKKWPWWSTSRPTLS